MKYSSDKAACGKYWVLHPVLPKMILYCHFRHSLISSTRKAKRGRRNGSQIQLAGDSNGKAYLTLSCFHLLSAQKLDPKDHGERLWDQLKCPRSDAFIRQHCQSGYNYRQFSHNDLYELKECSIPKLGHVAAVSAREEWPEYSVAQRLARLFHDCPPMTAVLWWCPRHIAYYPCGVGINDSLRYWLFVWAARNQYLEKEDSEEQWLPTRTNTLGTRPGVKTATDRAVQDWRVATSASRLALHGFRQGRQTASLDTTRLTKIRFYEFSSLHLFILQSRSLHLFVRIQDLD